MKIQLIAIGLLVCAMYCADASVSRKRSQVTLKKRNPFKFFKRVANLERAVTSIDRRLRRVEALEKRLVLVEKRGCDAGNVDAIVCDPENFYDYCTFQYFFYGDLKIADIPVKYNRFFKDAPVVTAGLSGIYTASGKNCTVETRDVTEKGFKIRVTLGGHLPFTLRIFWYACSGAIFH